MAHVLLAAVALVALPAGAGAGEVVVRLRVEPMPEPAPALKYQLLPEVGELIPGNAAQDYLKCFMEQRPFFFGRQGVDQRSRYLTMPLAELAAAARHGYGGFALRQADRAARMVGIDWQAVRRVQDGELETPPAELGPLQVLALALRARLRAEVACRRYDDAIVAAKTMFALGRHLGEYPSSLASRLGLWVVHLGLEGLEEMVQQPGCPNLYWALTDLPSPLVELRKGVQGDRTAVAAELRRIRGDARMTDAEIEACVGRLSGVVGFAREQAGRAPRSLRAGLAARADDPERLAAARRRLIEAGPASGLRDLLGQVVSPIWRMPPLQVILLDETRSYEIARDARIKLLALPLRQVESPAAGAAQPPRGEGLFDDLLPDVVDQRRRQGAVEREIALLRHVEALRLHAAGHAGRLPARLSEVGVPLPGDPFTGEPFGYAAEGASAHLRGASHRGEGDDPEDRVRFEVILRD